MHRTLYGTGVAALALSTMLSPRVAAAQPFTVLEPLATGGASLIRSSFGPGDFEVVVLQGSNLVHYWRDNHDIHWTWHQGQTISTSATAFGSCALIESNLGVDHNNFELVVQEGSNLVHYWHDNSDTQSPWQRGLTVATGVTGPGSIIQSSYGSPGNFEVLVPVNGEMEHFWHDNSNIASPWQRAPDVVPSGATGAACMIQSGFGGGDFEAVFPLNGNLWHYYEQGKGAWQPGAQIAANVSGPASFIQGTLGGNGNNFELAVPINGNLEHYYRDNSVSGFPWKDAGVIAYGANGPGAIIESNLGGDSNNFEVVVPVERPSMPGGAVPLSSATDFNLVHFYHDNTNVNLAWTRAQNVTFRGRSEKVCQLTGSYDAERYAPTTNNTAAFGMPAVDLGYPVDDGTTLRFLFGDVQYGEGLTPPEGAPNDAVGYSLDTSPPTGGVAGALGASTCVHMGVNWNASLFGLPQVTPPTVYPLISQGWFNVPSSGFVANGALYGLFWTNHCATTESNGQCEPGAAPGANALGNAVLAKSFNGGQTFTQVPSTPASSMPTRFRYTASINTDTIQGLPPGQDVGVLVYGVPCYRSSTPLLAVAPASQIENFSSWRYLESVNGTTPVWSAPGDEFDADTIYNATSDGPMTVGSPTCVDPSATGSATGNLFNAGCVGEMSVNWQPYLGEWVMLYNCQDNDIEPVRGQIRLRTAPAPWGPWSDPVVVFDPDDDNGYCHFMHDGTKDCDNVGGDNGNQSGGVYAPFYLSRFTQGFVFPIFGSLTRIYYTMSTWDPYQVVVMKSDLYLPWEE